MERNKTGKIEQYKCKRGKSRNIKTNHIRTGL